MKAFILITGIISFMFIALDAASSECSSNANPLPQVAKAKKSVAAKPAKKNNIFIKPAFFISKYNYSL